MQRAPSTISRELSRNAVAATAAYNARAAGKRAEALRHKPRRRSKLAPDTPLFGVVTDRLREGWSPEQIAGTLKRLWPDDFTRRVSHETIYTALYALPPGELRKDLIACLRQGHAGRRRRSQGTDRRGQIPDMVSLHVRPPEVEGFSRVLNRVHEPMRRTLTYDQGKEMSRHKELAEKSGIKIYFADPHSPWQRGTNENTNGLLRQCLPKGADLSVFSQEDLDAIAYKLNARPRKIHGFRSPFEVYAELLKNAQQSESKNFSSTVALGI